MSNRTFVCFACRTTERVSLSRFTRNCRKCRAVAEHVYYKFRIPPADDDKGWADLRVKVRSVNDQIKKYALQRLNAKAERYTRIVATMSEPRAKKIRRWLREVQDDIRTYEQWP